MNMKRSVLTPGLLAAMALLLLMPPPLAAKDKDYTGETVNWTISKGRVVEYGETSETGDGTLTLDYIVEADAFSENAPITKGLFRATVSAFTPTKAKKDKIGQKPGVWYIKAKWEIMDKNATKDKLKEKHNESLMKGVLTAELPFNPAIGVGSVNARADFPLTLVGKHWGRGSGGFYGNELFEGDMNLTFDRWQKVK